MSAPDASKPASNGAAAGGGDAQDLTVFVQSLLEQMQSRFAQMSDAIIGRNILSPLSRALDEMGARIDELEKSIGDLMEQTNEDGADKSGESATASNSSAAKEKGELV